MTAMNSLAVQRAEILGRMDDKPRFEIIDGQRVELPPMSILANRVANNLLIRMGNYLLGDPVGEASMETLIH